MKHPVRINNKDEKSYLKESIYYSSNKDKDNRPTKSLFNTKRMSQNFLKNTNLLSIP